MEVQGKLDASGEAISGTGKDLPLDVNSPFVKKPFRRELEFWLKRLNGKKAKKLRASARPANSSDLAQPR